MALRSIDYTNTIEQWYNQYNLLTTDVGDLTGLTTVETGTIVGAVNELETNHNALDAWVGTRSLSLTGGIVTTTTLHDAVEGSWNDLYDFLARGATIDTSSNTVVGALNEIHGEHDALDARVGDLSSIAVAVRGADLTTSVDNVYDDYYAFTGRQFSFNTTATTLLGAINEVHDERDALDTRVGALATLNNDIEGASIVTSMNLLDVKFENFTGFGTSLTTAANDLAGAVNELETNHNALDDRVGDLSSIDVAIRAADVTQSIDAFYNDYIIWAAPAVAFDTTSQTATGAVNELHGQHDDLDTRVGALATLNNDIEGASIVASINLADVKFENWTGFGTSLNTAATNLAAAINENHAQADGIRSDLGALGDISATIRAGTNPDTFATAINFTYDLADTVDARVGALGTITSDIRGASIVASINLLDVKFENFSGFGTTLNTSASNLAAAVNELHGEINSNDTDINSIRSAITGSTGSVSLTGLRDAIEGANLVTTINNFYDAYASRTDVGTALNTTASTLAAAINEVHGPTGVVTVANRDNVDLQSLHYRAGNLADLDAGISGANNDSLVAAINYVYNLQTGETVEFTNANITGTLDVGGTATFDTTVNVQGAFTSLGIDDNATANRLQIENTSTTIKNALTVQGAITSTGQIQAATNVLVGANSGLTNNAGEWIQFDNVNNEVDIVAGASTRATIGAAATFFVNLNANAGLDVTGTLNVDGSEVFHPGNMGSGSNLDADKLDGVQLVNIARTDVAETFTSNVTIQGNLTVNGTTTTINTTNLNVSDNIIVLNNDVTGTPSENAGIEVERGTSANVSVRWNETSDVWELTQNGTNFYRLLTINDEGSLDAGTLGGQNGAYYRNASNINAGTLAAARVANLDASKITTGVFADARIPNLNASKITAGTLASARLPDLVVADFANAAIQTSVEAFSNSDTVLMTAAAIEDKILSYGYTTNVGDITNVTAGGGLTGGGASGSVTISHADTSSVSNVTTSGKTVIDDLTFDTYGHVTGRTTRTLDFYTTGEADAAFLGISATAANSSLLGGQNSAFYRNASNLNAGTINDARLPSTMSGKNFSGNVNVDIIGSVSGNWIALTAGESSPQATTTNLGTTTENVWLIGESGVKAVSSSDNWTSNWAGRHEATVIDSSGNSSFPGTVNAAGMTVNSNTVWHAGNDGPGSTLNADLLDNQQGTYYLNYNNFTNTPTIGNATITISAGSGLSGGAAFTTNQTSNETVSLSVAGLTRSNFNQANVQLNNESFSYSNEIFMTAAAIEDRILSKGYTTNVGDITGVTAGTGLTGGGTSGTVTLNVSGLTTAQFAGAAIQTSGEAFSNVDTVLMTAAAIEDKILSYGYTTNTGDITGVTAGGGLTGGGTSGSVTISHADTSSQASVNNSGGTVIQDITLDTYGHITSIVSTNLDSRFLGISATAANSQLLDSLDSTQFLRSDATDVKTSGILRFNDSVNCTFGSSDDFEIFHNGSHAYMDMNLGNLYLRDGTTTRFTFADNGAFTATGDVTAFSDVTLKKLMRPIESPLENIQRLSGMTYYWNDKAAKKGLTDEGRQIGLVAQEVEAVYPELVVEDDDGVKKVKYEKMVPVLLEAIKELTKKVEALENANS